MCFLSSLITHTFSFSNPPHQACMPHSPADLDLAALQVLQVTRFRCHSHGAQGWLSHPCKLWHQSKVKNHHNGISTETLNTKSVKREKRTSFKENTWGPKNRIWDLPRNEWAITKASRTIQDWHTQQGFNGETSSIIFWTMWLETEYNIDEIYNEIL